MNKAKIILVAIVLMPFFAQSTQSSPQKQLTAATPKMEKEKMSKSEADKQEKEAYLTRLLVKPVDQCNTWPMCD